MSAMAGDDASEAVRIILHVERWPRDDGWGPLPTPEPLAAPLLAAAKRIHYHDLRMSPT